jgi:hypothetical protein
LQELQDIITSRKDSLEPWFAALVTKILLSVNRVRLDLLKTMEEETVSGAAWNARNLLEFLNCGSGLNCPPPDVWAAFPLHNAEEGSSITDEIDN